MRLYHFTCPLHAPTILREGITRGDNPTSPVQGFNSPWLTTDPVPENQAWAGADSRPLFADKTTVRLTVEVPDEGFDLVHWPEFASKHIAPEYARALATSGGDANSWYFSTTTIRPEWITEIALREDVADEVTRMLFDHAAAFDAIEKRIRKLGRQAKRRGEKIYPHIEMTEEGPRLSILKPGGSTSMSPRYGSGKRRRGRRHC